MSSAVAPDFSSLKKMGSEVALDLSSGCLYYSIPLLISYVFWSYLLPSSNSSQIYPHFPTRATLNSLPMQNTVLEILLSPLLPGSSSSSFTHKVQFLLFSYSWVWGLSTGCGWPIWADTIRETWLSLSQTLSDTTISLSSSEIYCYLHFGI